jgi:aspartokinase-like uncharacterized kinase
MFFHLSQVFEPEEEIDEAKKVPQQGHMLIIPVRVLFSEDLGTHSWHVFTTLLKF